MIAHQKGVPVTANNTYIFSVPRPNKEYVVEISGEFGGAAATLGYLSQSGVAVPYTEVDQMTANAGWIVTVPNSSQLTLAVTGVSGGTSITLNAFAFVQTTAIS